MQISRSTARSARRLTLAVIAGAVAFTATAPAAQADLKVGKNFRLPADNSGFRGKDELSLAVNPANPQHVIATNSDYLDESCEATASFDGGTTWSNSFPLQVPTPGIGAPFLPSCRVSNHAGESMFQGVTFGTGLNVYAVAITPRATGGVEEGASALVYKSTDGGVTWGTGVIAMPGGTGSTAATGPYYELPSILVKAGGGTAGADLVYTVAHDSSGSGTGAVAPCPCANMRVARSLDGGTTWGAPVIASTPTNSAVDGASPALASDGTLSLTYRTGPTNVPAIPVNPSTATTGEIHFVKSADNGLTFSAPVVITNVSNLARSSASHVTPQFSNASSFPRLAVNPSNASLLYVVYNQSAPPNGPTGTYLGTDHFIPPDSVVWFQRSLNGGTTWSTPKLINDNLSPIKPGTQVVQTRHPNVSVAPNGRIDIVWEDRRHWYQGPGERTCLHTHLFCDDARLGDTYYAFSGDGGATFSANRRISDDSHNNDTGFDYRFATYWAFGPVSVPMGSDKLLVGWMDSREGSFDSDNQDIYLAKVDHAAAATIPQSTVDGGDPVGLSVALSQTAYPGGGEGLLRSTFASRNGTKVVIVNQDNVPAALAGSVLARANVGPVLLSPAGGLPASVKAEILRLAPAGAYVIGDAGQLSAQVETDLEDAGIPLISRISGNSDARLAANIAAQFDRRTPEAANRAFDAVVIANPASPDAVAAAGLAAARRLPILYVNANSVPAATSGALTSMNIDRTLVIGDTADVSAAVMASLPGTATRLGGADQYATSAAVATESLARGLPSNVVYVASGDRPIDAALTGAAVGRTTGIMVLSPGSALPATAAAGLTGIDRNIVVKPSVAPAAPAGPAVTPPPPPPPPPATVPPSCGKVKVVKNNASKIRTRADLRLLLPCDGKLTATATARLRVKGKTKTVRQKVSIKKLSGLNRSVRVTLTAAALRQLNATRVLRITIRTTYTPATLSATSKKSTRTVNVTLRLAKKSVGK